MSKGKLTLEFEYRTHDYVNEINVECYDIEVKPTGELAEHFPGDFQRVLRSVATSPTENGLSIIAMQFKEAMIYRALDVEIADEAIFKDEAGKETRVKPATITLH